MLYVMNMSYGKIISSLNYYVVASSISRRTCVPRLLSTLHKETLRNETHSPNITIRNNVSNQSLPLIVLFGRMDGKYKHLARYSEIFEKKDFTTICVTTSTKSTYFRTNTEAKKESLHVKKVLEELMQNNPERKVIFYALSFGGMFMQHMVLIENNNFTSFQAKNIKGMIFDSCPIFLDDYAKIRVEAQKVHVEPVTNTASNFLLKYIVMIICYVYGKSNSYKHLKRLMSKMLQSEIKPPHLFLFSKKDNVARYRDILGFIDRC